MHVYSTFENVENEVNLAGYSMRWMNEAIIPIVTESVSWEVLDLYKLKTTVQPFCHRVFRSIKAMDRHFGVTIRLPNDYPLARLNLHQ